MFIQQGDVLLVSCDTIKGKKLLHRVLAEGEITGHLHEIVFGEADLFQDGEDIYMEVYSERAGLSHPEHDWKNKLRRKGDTRNLSEGDKRYLESIGIDLTQNFEDIIKTVPSETVVPRGKFKIDFIQEYDHFKEEAKRIAD